MDDDDHGFIGFMSLGRGQSFLDLRCLCDGREDKFKAQMSYTSKVDTLRGISVGQTRSLVQWLQARLDEFDRDSSSRYHGAGI